MIHKIIESKGIVILRPDGPLKKSDFEALSKDVDAYLEMHGHLNGLLIKVEEFPGWEDFASFEKHLQFIKNHIKKIRRVAIVSSSKLATFSTHVMQHISPNEILEFASDAEREAFDWLSEA